MSPCLTTQPQLQCNTTQYCRGKNKENSNVGLSNVMPYKPKMDLVRGDVEVGGPGPTWYKPGAQERRPLGHNTYHGPSEHHSILLSGLATPLRFVECPQMAGVGRRPSQGEEEDVVCSPHPR